MNIYIYTIPVTENLTFWTLFECVWTLLNIIERSLTFMNYQNDLVEDVKTNSSLIKWLVWWASLWRCLFRESKPLLLIKRCACDVLFLSPTKPVFLYLIIRFLKALADIWILIVFKALETTKYLYFIPLNLLSLKKLKAASLCWFYDLIFTI